MKKKLFIGAGAFLFVGLIIGAINDDGEEAASEDDNEETENTDLEETNVNNNNDSDSDEETNEPEESQTTEEYLTDLVEDIQGLESGPDSHPEAIQDMYISDDEKNVELVLMTRDFAAPEMLIADAERMAEQYFTRIFMEDNGIEEFELIYQAPSTKDKMEILSIFMYEETADNIDWDSFNRAAFEREADEYWILNELR